MRSASASMRRASPITTSSIASLTASSKRDMCTPFWSGAQVAEARDLGLEEPLGAVVADADRLRRPRDAGAR